MKPKLARALRWIAVVIVALGLLYAILLGLSAYQLHNAYAALKAAGRPMKAEDIVPPPVKPEENGALLYQAAVQRLRGQPLENGNLFDGLSKPAADALGENASTEQIERARLLLRQEASRDALRFIALGAQKPQCRFEVDYTKGAGVLLPHLAELRNLSRIVAAEARVLAADGDMAGAWHNAITGLELADALRTEPLLISQLVRVAQSSIAIKTIQTLCEAAAPSPADLATAQRQLAAREDRRPFVAAMDGERLLIGEWAFGQPLNTLAAAGGGSPSSPLLRPYVLVTPLVQADHATYLLLMQDTSDVVGSPFPQEVESFARRNREIPRWALFSRLLVPALSRFADEFARFIARERLTRLGLVLLSQRQPGAPFPPALPVVEGQDLNDPFTGKPLIYRPEGDGFLLYSVGPNRTDDGGVQDHRQGKDDETWRFGKAAGGASQGAGVAR